MGFLKQAGITFVPTGLSHGTITAIIDHQPFEITTLRHDVSTDGRWATVDFTDDWQADASRRDFTMNALYLSATGQVFDYFDGLSHLNQGEVRFIGDPAQRIQEDYLRILRYFRFYTRFHKGAHDPHVHEVIQGLKDNLGQLSPERVQMEITLLLNLPQPDRGIDAMVKTGVFEWLWSMDNPSPLWQHVRHWEDRLCLSPAFERRLVALLGGDMILIDRWLSQFKYPLKTQKNAHTLCQLLAPPLLSKQAILYYHGPEIFLNWCPFQENPVVESLTAFGKAWAHRPLPLSGKHLLNLGLKGPEVGHMLHKLEIWWLEQDRLPDEAACLKWVQQQLS
jgi:poly(A) polymerase